MVKKRRATAPRAQTEAEFLAEYDITQFERPSVAVDVAVFTAFAGTLRVAVYKRSEHPAKGRYALPGGFVRMDESLDDAAARLLREKAGLSGVFIEQLRTFGDLGRDPRGRIITVAYFALLDPGRFDEIAADQGALGARVSRQTGRDERVELVDRAGDGLPLAFDHRDIITTAVKQLRARLDEATLALKFLPECFTLRELQGVHEAVRGVRVNKDSFRRSVLARGILVPTGDYEAHASHRPAELYRCGSA